MPNPMVPSPNGVIVPQNTTFFVEDFTAGVDPEPHYLPRGPRNHRLVVRKAGTFDDTPTSLVHRCITGGRGLAASVTAPLEADTKYELVRQRRVGVWPDEQLVWLNENDQPPPPKWVLSQFMARRRFGLLPARFVAVVTAEGPVDELDGGVQAEVVVLTFQTSASVDREPPRWADPGTAAVTADYFAPSSRGRDGGPVPAAVVMPVWSWVDPTGEPAGVAVAVSGPSPSPAPVDAGVSALSGFAAVIPATYSPARVSFFRFSHWCPTHAGKDVRLFLEGQWWVRLVDVAGNFSEPRRLRIRRVPKSEVRRPSRHSKP